MELLFVNNIWGVIFSVIGALIIIIPQFYIHAGYTLKNGVMRYNKGFFKVVEIIPEKVPALLITVCDAYTQFKGYKTVYINIDGQKMPVPALLLVSEVDKRNLALCDSKNNAKICCKESLIAETYLNFKFLRQFLDCNFSGDIYIYEPIYLAYKHNFDSIIPQQLKDKTTVFKRTD